MADRPGRNEPCWCGSGRKYKKCHMNADREADRARLGRSLAVRFLREDMLTFAQDERFAIPFAAALSHYWNGYYTVENATEMSENEALRFFDWFVFDYQPDEETERLADRYREERWEDLSTPQQSVLEAWLQSGPAGGYVLEDYDGQILHLRDFLTDEMVDVYDPAGRGGAEIGDLILARLLPGPEHAEGQAELAGQLREFSPAPAYIPEAEIADLREKLEAARAEDSERHPEATVDDFLRRHNALFVHHALAQAEAQGRPPVARLDEG